MWGQASAAAAAAAAAQPGAQLALPSVKAPAHPPLLPRHGKDHGSRLRQRRGGHPGLVSERLGVTQWVCRTGAECTARKAPDPTPPRILSLRRPSPPAHRAAPEMLWGSKCSEKADIYRWEGGRVGQGGVGRVQASRLLDTRCTHPRLGPPHPPPSFGIIMWEICAGEQPERGRLRDLRCVAVAPAGCACQAM